MPFSEKQDPDFEIQLLIDTIKEKYCVDFSGYIKSSLKERIANFIIKNSIDHITELRSMLIYDGELFESFLHNISITATEMFRDPDVYLDIKRKIFPVLTNKSNIKIWHAGCSTGEEVYSLAILLSEYDLLRRTQIFATDINTVALKTAETGIYPYELIKQVQANYQKLGGNSKLSAYFSTKYDSVIISPELKKNIYFLNHNLISDSAFTRIDIILCRNVLIYFEDYLRNSVLGLFDQSLNNNGFLILGKSDDLAETNIDNFFYPVTKKTRIFKKSPYS